MDMKYYRCIVVDNDYRRESNSFILEAPDLYSANTYCNELDWTGHTHYVDCEVNKPNTNDFRTVNT